MSFLKESGWEEACRDQYTVGKGVTAKGLCAGPPHPGGTPHLAAPWHGHRGVRPAAAPERLLPPRVSRVSWTLLYF